MPQSSPALPQQGFLEGGFNNGGGPPGGPGAYNQRYEMGIPGGMPTPPIHPMGGGEPPMFDQFLGDQSQQLYGAGGGAPGPPGSGGGPNALGGPYGGSIPGNGNSVPAHFLANDRPPDEGGGFNRRACDMSADVCGDSCSHNGGVGKNQCCTSNVLICTICDKRFTLKAHFDAHLKTHQTHHQNAPLTARGLISSNSMAGLNNGSQRVSPHGGHSGPNGPNGPLGPQDLFGTTELPPSPSFSPGIPTPQSSLDSLSCFAGSNVSTNSRLGGPHLTFGGPNVGQKSGPKDPLSELTATVEATVPYTTPPASTLNSTPLGAAPQIIS